MKQSISSFKISANKMITLLKNSFKVAVSDVWESTLKKENLRPQVIFWLLVFAVYFLDTVPLQGFGIGRLDEFLEQNNIYRKGTLAIFYEKYKQNSGQGTAFTIATLLMGFICSYINLILFKWLKYIDEPLEIDQITPYNFSNTFYFKIYLFLFLILGYLGALLIVFVVRDKIDFASPVLFNFRSIGHSNNYATPLRQMPECLIIMWSFLGFDFYLKNAKRQKDWKEEKQKNRIEQDKIQLEAHNTAIQLQMLQTRIKPHFLLNIIRLAFNRTEKVDKEAAALLEKLANILRYTVAVSEERIEKTKLKEEAHYLTELIELKKYYNNDLSVDLEIAPHVFEEDILLIEQGILDEFLLNAFKYAATDKESSIKPYIKIFLITDEDNFLTYMVENSTLINELYPENIHSTGVGLENVKQRLLMLYPQKHTITFENATKGIYKVIITLDLNKDNE